MESPSRNQNANLLLYIVELRGNSVVTLRKILRIVSPLPVALYLIGDIPILEYHEPAIVLH